jgi:sec-independent protein translocase protein TatA
MPFNIGPGELIVILALGLIIFGPKKLPELGKSLGEAIMNFKKSFQRGADDTQKEQNELSS